MKLFNQARNYMTIAIVAGVAIIGLVFVPTVTAESETKIKHVKGDFTLQFHPPGPACQPWTGACLIGTATGDLAGDVFIRVNNSYLVEGSARTVSVSNADITINTSNGEIKGAAAGSLDRSSGEFHNVTSWVGGTGDYVQATGFVRVDGFDTPAGVEHSSYEGDLILPKD